MQLSELDLRLLRFAVEHGLHFSDQELAKKLRLSPSTVNYALNKLRRHGVIRGLRLKVDYRKLGFSALAWILFSVKDGEEYQRKLISELLSYPQVHVAAFVTGEKDIALKVIDKDVFSLNQFILNISEKFSNEIQEPLVLFSTKQFKVHNVCVEPSVKPEALDSLDFALLNERMLDPELTLARIAKELSIHKNTASKRWRKLCKKKIVLKKSPLLNPGYYSDIGIALKALVLFNVNPVFKEKFVSMLSKMPEVHELHSLLSGHDFLSVVRTSGIPAFYSLISQISSVGKGLVRKTVSHVFLKIESKKPNYLSELRNQGIISF